MGTCDDRHNQTANSYNSDVKSFHTAIHMLSLALMRVQSVQLERLAILNGISTLLSTVIFTGLLKSLNLVGTQIVR